MVNVPSEQALGSLPRWALVAFAVRCARRVEPLFKQAWPEAPEHHLATLTRAVEEIEQCAAKGLFAEELARNYANSVAAIADLADEESAEVANSGAYFAAHAMANAAGCVAHPEEAVTAANCAAHDASVALSSISGEVDDPIRDDFQLLLSLAQNEQWTNDTTVGPETFLVGPH